MFKFLKEPALQGITIGTPEYFKAQNDLILRRPLLKYCYDLWYKRLLSDAESVKGSGIVLELGSGGGYVKTLDKTVVTSDVYEGIADRVVDARELPFEDGSVKAIFLTHAFHHIPDTEAFLREAQRVLVPGGVVSMIEVAHTPFARFFFDRFHEEPYDDSVREWNFQQNDSMMDANQALSWVIFFRDKNRFRERVPGLVLEKHGFLPWFTYLISGGVTLRYMIPRFLTWPLIFAEKILKPLSGLFSLHWHLRLRKVESSS